MERGVEGVRLQTTGGAFRLPPFPELPCRHSSLGSPLFKGRTRASAGPITFKIKRFAEGPLAGAQTHGIGLSPKATKIVVSKRRMKALDRKGLQAGRSCSQLIRTKLVALLCSVCLPLSLTACGPKGHEQEGHQAVSRTPELAPPTPDVTPIEILRTPAGLALKTEEEAPATETPVSGEATPLPASTPAPS